MKKWYEQTWAIILLLIFFFPVGLFLMWKYTNWNKFAKGGVSALVVIAFIIGVTGGGNENVLNTPPTSLDNPASSQGDNKPETPNESKPKNESKQKVKKDDPEVLKAVALSIDSQVYENVVKSEEVTAILQDGINLVSAGQGDMLELYDLAKTAKETQSTLYSNLLKLQDDNNKPYVEASQMYIANSKALAEKLMKYIDKGEMKYLSEAKDCIENSESYTVSVIAARMGYLSDQGLTDEEISKLLTPDSSSKSE